MKRILICLSIATFSIMGVSAQEGTPEYRAYMQQQERELQEAIREQTQYHTAEAAKRMATRKREVQNDLEARRAQLTYRPDNMVDYQGN